MDYTKELKHLSLCAGYGGIDLGLARALGAVRTVAFVEIEAFAVVNLVKKIEAGHLDECPIFTDLKAFPWELYRGQVDILSGGFPCQPFSSAGRRAGDSDPRHLWPYIADGVRRMGSPPVIFLENVEGIISSKLRGDGWSDPEGTPVLLHVLRELERLGYEAAAGVFSASEVGAPHQRKRVFILGCRADLSEAGRGIVDRLLRGTERGQEMAHTMCCTRGQGRTDGGHIFEASKDRQAGKPCRYDTVRPVWPAPRGAEQYPWEPSRVTMGNAPGKGLEGSAGESVQGREPRPTSASVGNTKNKRLQRCKHDETPNSAQRRQTKNGRFAGTNTCARGTVGDTDIKRLQGQTATKQQGEGLWRSVTRPTAVQRQVEPSMGRDIDGSAGRMGYAELCESLDNRTDELRLLGNGVVPATAERAFRVLWKDLRAR